MRRLVLLLMFTAALAGAQPPEYALSAVPFRAGARLSDARLPLTGVHRAVAAEAREVGAWRTAPDGRRVWQLAVRSPGATAVRLEFRNFDAGAGRLWLHDGAGGEVVGPYTGAGPFDDGSFWSGSVFGDRVVVEYEPAGEGAALPFEIVRLSHQLFDPASRGMIGSGTEGEGACHVDATCQPDWAEAGKSVALILIETPQGQASCSGGLVATKYKSGLPYFLTADHCVSDDAAARTVEAFWAYQTPACNGKAPALRSVPRTPVGARYLVSRPQISADFSLLLLPSVPPGATFAEWDATDPAARAEVIGIHHPRGSFQRISRGTLTGTYWEMDYSEVPRQNYHQVLWNSGIVEPGSSGSPLFNSAKKLVGVLSYGYRIGDYAWCDIKPSIAAYGRFSVAYGELRSYLDDPPPGTLSVAPDRVAFRVDNRAVTPAPVQRLVARTPDGAPIQVASDSPWLAVRPSAGSWDLEIKPNLISRSGLYTAVVSVTSAGLTRTVPVTADVTVRPSAVRVTATPNPVPAGEPDAEGCQWSFAVSLEETSGVATSLTRVRFGGYDLTGQAEQIFGASGLKANGRLEAKLRYCGAAAEHVLEFAGVDDATRITWNRSVTVQFR